MRCIRGNVEVAYATQRVVWSLGQERTDAIISDKYTDFLRIFCRLWNEVVDGKLHLHNRQTTLCSCGCRCHWICSVEISLRQFLFVQVTRSADFAQLACSSCKIPAPSYTWTQKKVPLSGRASSYRPLQEVPPPCIEFIYFYKRCRWWNNSMRMMMLVVVYLNELQ